MLRLLVLAIVLLLCPLASAAYSLDVTSSQPLGLDGMVSVEAHQTVVRVKASRLTGELELDIRGGEARIYDTRELHAQATLQPHPAVAPLPQEEKTVHTLAAGRLTLRYDNEPAFYLARAEQGGIVGLRGTASSRGEPHVLAQSFNDGERVGLEELEGERVAWQWDAGWLFTGAFDDRPTPFAGFPLTDAAKTRTWMRGPMTLVLDGGNVTFTDASGRLHEPRLGRWSEQNEGISSGLPAREQFHRWMVLEVEVAAGEGPVGGDWGVAAPAMTWRIGEAARWTNATGTWRNESTGAVTRFHDERVVATGVFDVTPSAPITGARAVAPVRYEARGIDELRVGSAALAQQQESHTAATAAAGVTVGVSLLILARLALVLYTRIKREELLDHPARRAVYHAAHAAPGTPARELQRASGLAWGAFNLHLRALVQGRYLRTERVGHYLLVYPVGTHAPGIPSPAARAVYAALPANGAGVSVSACRENLGMSRQLLDHHLKSLAQRGLVRLERDETRGERVVARAHGPGG